MPDVFDQIAPTAPAPTRGDVFDQIAPTGGDVFDALPSNVQSQTYSGISTPQVSSFTPSTAEGDTPPQPTQPIGQAIENASNQFGGHVYRMAGGLLQMFSGGEPHLQSMGKTLSSWGATQIQNNPVTNEAAAPISTAINLSPLLLVPEAAPEVMAGMAAGEGKSNAMDAMTAKGWSPEEADRLSNIVGATQGALGYASGSVFPGPTATGSTIINRAIGGAAAAGIQGVGGKLIDQAATGQSQSWKDVASNTLTTAGVGAAFGALQNLMQTPPAKWQIPDEYKPTFEKVQQIRQGVADGTIDPKLASDAMKTAVGGQVADTGTAATAKGGQSVATPTGGIILTPRDGAVIRSLYTGEAPPAIGSDIPAAPIQSTVGDVFDKISPTSPDVFDQVTPTQTSGTVSQGTYQGPAEAAQEPLAEPATPRVAAPPGFSKSALEARILAAYTPDIGDTIGAASELDQVPFANYWRGRRTSDLPEEVQNAVQANPDLSRAINFTPDGPTGGPDALHQFGDRYFDLLGQVAQTKTGILQSALDSARNSPDPEVQFLAAVHDNLPAPQDRVPQTVVDANKDLQTGDEFEIQGHHFQVIEDEDGYRMLKDGGAFPMVPLDALGKIPIDKGFDIQKGSEPEASFAPPDEHSGVSTGLFGQGVIDSSGIGEQQPMFHQPVDVPAPAADAQDQAIANKFDPGATPQMFPARFNRPTYSRQGMVNTKLLTAPIESFVKDDVVPSAKAVGSVFASAKDDIQRTFAPQTRGKAATYAKGALREAGAEIDRRDAIVQKAFGTAERYFKSQPDQANLDFYTAVETGQGITDPKLAAPRALLRTAFEQRYQEMKGLGIEPGYIDDYLPHLYTDPAKAQAFASDFLAKRPLEGTKSFKKQRTFPTLQDGVNAGLVPRTYNPMTMARLALHQMDKYIAISKVKAELKTNGMRQFVSAGAKPPAGLATTTDRADTVYGISAQKERVIRGHYYYPDPVVNLINNYLSPGIGNKGWYRGAMWLKNNMNLFNLGYSAFHITFTTGNSFAAKIGTALQYAGDGNLKMAAQKFVEIPVAPFADMVRGSRMLSEWVKPGSAGHDYAQVADAYLAGGGVAKRPSAYRETITKGLIDAISKGNIAGALIRVPAATAQSLGHLIMEHYVPRIKNGAAIDQLRYNLDRTNGPISRPQLREMMSKVVDRQDDTFGELEYRNLFWNKTAHQLGQLLVRAQGWTLGTVRMGAHTAIDTAATPWRVAKGGPLITLAMGRAIGIALATAAFGALIQKIMTGKNPESLEDLIYPRTGGRDKDGNEIRFKLPTYANEAMSWATRPISTLAHKASPLVSEMLDAITNEDYFGNKITDPSSSSMQHIKDYAMFFAKQLLPFSVQSQNQLKQEGASLGTRALSFLGVSRAPAEVIRTPAQNLAAKFSADNRTVGGMTPAQAAKAQVKSLIEDAFAQSRADGTKAMQAALQAGQITPYEAMAISRQSGETNLQYRVKSETIDQATQVWNVASDQEKQEIAPAIYSKIYNGLKRGTITPDAASTAIGLISGRTSDRKRAG